MKDRRSFFRTLAIGPVAAAAALAAPPEGQPPEASPAVPPLSARWKVEPYSWGIPSYCEMVLCDRRTSPPFYAKWLVGDRSTGVVRALCDACMEEFRISPVAFYRQRFCSHSYAEELSIDSLRRTLQEFDAMRQVERDVLKYTLTPRSIVFSHEPWAIPPSYVCVDPW